MPEDFADPCSVGGCDNRAVMGFTFDAHSFRDEMEIRWRCFDHAPEVR
jgi:hypothetical protein